MLVVAADGSVGYGVGAILGMLVDFSVTEDLQTPAVLVAAGNISCRAKGSSNLWLLVCGQDVSCYGGCSVRGTAADHGCTKEQNGAERLDCE